MKDYKNIDFDHGGSSCQLRYINKAFYLTDVTIGGNSSDASSHTWYTSLTKLPNDTNNTTFQDLANTTFAEAGRLYRNDSKEQKALCKAMFDDRLATNI